MTGFCFETFFQNDAAPRGVSSSATHSAPLALRRRFFLAARCSYRLENYLRNCNSVSFDTRVTQQQKVTRNFCRRKADRTEVEDNLRVPVLFLLRRNRIVPKTSARFGILRKPVTARSLEPLEKQGSRKPREVSCGRINP